MRFLHILRSFIKPKPDTLFNKDYVLLLLTSMFFSASLQLTLPLIPLYWDKLLFSEQTIGFLLALTPVGTVLTMPLLGKLVDTHSKKHFLIIGFCLFSGPFFLYPLQANILLLGFIRLTQGIGIACYLPAAYAAISDVSPPRKRGEAMGFFGVAKAIILGTAPAFALHMRGNIGFENLFLFASSFAIFGILLVTTLSLKPPQINMSLSRKRIVDVIKMPPIIISIIVMFTATTTYGAITFLPLWANTVNIDNPGVFYTIKALFLLLSSFAGGILSDRMGRLNIALPSLLLMSAGLLILGLANNIPLLIICAALFGTGFGALQASLNAYVIDVTDSSYRGTAIGTYQASFDLGLGFGQFSYGFLAAVLGYSGTYLLMSIFAAISFMAIYIPTGKK